MGIFKSKKPKTVECDACGIVYAPGEGRPHVYTHIAKISQAEPSWLPAHLRAQAQGEYIFRCGRCDSFPSMKWPSEGGAYSGLMLHLGVAHHAGMFGDQGSSVSLRSSVKFDMILAE
jgi:hypothetical protein